MPGLNQHRWRQQLVELEPDVHVFAPGDHPECLEVKPGEHGLADIAGLAQNDVRPALRKIDQPHPLTAVERLQLGGNAQPQARIGATRRLFLILRRVGHVNRS